MELGRRPPVQWCGKNALDTNADNIFFGGHHQEAMGEPQLALATADLQLATLVGSQLE